MYLPVNERIFQISWIYKGLTTSTSNHVV